MADSRCKYYRNRNMLKHLLAVVLLSALSIPSTDTTQPPLDPVCQKEKKSDAAHQLPALPDKWVMRIEMDDMVNNSTTDIMEYYDTTTDRSALKIWRNGTKTQIIMYYKTSQVVILQFANSRTSPSSCVVKDLAKDRVKYVFGMTEHGNTDTMFSAHNVLRFGGNLTEVYQGHGTSRDGIVTDVWRACTFLPSLNGTFQLDWHFSNEYIQPEYETRVFPDMHAIQPMRQFVTAGTGTKLTTFVLGAAARTSDKYTEFRKIVWSVESNHIMAGCPLVELLPCVDLCSDAYAKFWGSPIGKSQTVPVQLHLEGYINSTKYVHRDFYITEFRIPTYDMSTDFEIPLGSYCSKLLAPKPMNVKLKDWFSFAAEINKPLYRYVDMVKEYYDATLNLTRLDSRPNNNTGLTNFPFGQRLIHQVHDITTGTVYYIDVEGGNCTPVADSPDMFDTTFTASGVSRIRTSLELLYLDGHHEYNGPRKVRGIDTNVWVSRRNDYPLGGPVPNSLFEWHLATSIWSEKVGTLTEFDLPVMLRITSPDQKLNQIYNFYQFSQSDPQIWQTDITGCYNSSQMKQFKVSFDVSFTTISQNIPAFKYAFMQSLIGAAGGISPLRMTKLFLDHTATSVIVSFVILDNAPPISALSRGLPLSTVVTLITENINSGSFQVQLNSAKFPNVSAPILIAKKYSASVSDVKDINYIYLPPSNGYSSGAMGGLAVGLLVLGFAVGFLILFGVYKLRGGSFTKSFSPKTFIDKENES